MRLYRPAEIPVRVDTLLCRQSRLMSTFGLTLMAALLVGAPILWWFLGAPWPVWGGCGLLAVLIVPSLCGTFVALFRPTNWVVRLRPDGVWVNLRSYRNNDLEEAESVLHLDYSEIAAARQHVDSFSTPTGSGSSSVRAKKTSLELELRHRRTDILRTALAEERSRRGPARTWLGIVTVSGKTRHYPVSVPADNVVRIGWRGREDCVVPRLESVLGTLSSQVSTAEPSRRDRGDWNELSDAEIDELVLDLVQSGSTIDAVKLLVRRRGFTTTDARRFVEELSQRPL